MSTSEKIASVIAQFIAADREEDRKRIAELERDLARALVREREANERTGAAIHRVQSLENGAEWERKDVAATIDNLNKQLDELTEKCAALVLEKELARGELVKLRGDNQRPIEQLAMGNPYGPGLVETPAVKRTPQVGDRVRILDGANAGETATVRAVDSVDPDCFCLMLSNNERWFAHVDDLEVIE